MPAWLAPLLAALVAPAAAVAPGWFDRGPGRVTLGATGTDTQVDVPVLRGHADPRARVEVRLGEGDPIAALVDLAHGPMRIGGVLAARHGLAVRTVPWRGRTVRTARVDWLRVGDAVLQDVRLEVVSGDELVLGLGSVPQLASALLASEGVLRLVPAADADALLDAVSAAMASPATPTRWTERAIQHDRSGPWLAVPVELVLTTGQPVTGFARLRTERARSTVAVAGAPEAIRGGRPEVLATWSVPTASLGRSWTPVHEGPDPSPDTIAVLGADLLSRADVAVAPERGRVAVRAVPSATWTPLEDTLAIWADVKADGVPEPDVASEPVSLPAGDPGDLLGRARWGGLADARWAAGQVDAALRADRHLAAVAGDHCAAWLALGRRELAAGRPVQAEDTLERAAELFEAWARASAAHRRAARLGGAVDPNSLAIPQAEGCEEALGEWMRARLAATDVQGAEVLLARDLQLDPGPTTVLGLAWSARPQRAEPLLRQAIAAGGAPAPVWVALARAHLAQGRPHAARAVLEGLPGQPDGRPLTTAFEVVALAAKLDPDGTGAPVVGRLLDDDPLWVELALAASASDVPLPEGFDLAELLAAARAARPQDPTLACVDALDDLIEVALPPRIAAAPHPDCLVARWVAARRHGATPAVEALEAQLRRRWPTVDLGRDDP